MKPSPEFAMPLKPHIPHRAWILALAFLGACSDGLEPCHGGKGCPEGGICLFDEGLQQSYCSKLCSRESDCPNSQSCQSTVSTPFRSERLKICVSRQRSCASEERCDGLDNDCDGQVDGPDCKPITRCTEDRQCGAFVCSAVPGEAETRCIPKAEGKKSAFMACEHDEECYHGLCETGFCAPLCQNPKSCPFDLAIDGRRYPLTCLGAVSAKGRPPHNACQVSCATEHMACPAPSACRWDVGYAEQAAEQGAVCGLLNPEKIPTGQACQSRTPGSDATCQQGLCIDDLCTRPCAPGDTCSDLGSGARCRRLTLSYGAKNLYQHVCVRPQP